MNPFVIYNPSKRSGISYPLADVVKDVGRNAKLAINNGQGMSFLYSNGESIQKNEAKNIFFGNDRLVS